MGIRHEFAISLDDLFVELTIRLLAATAEHLSQIPELLRLGWPLQPQAELQLCAAHMQAQLQLSDAPTGEGANCVQFERANWVRLEATLSVVRHDCDAC